MKKSNINKIIIFNKIKCILLFLLLGCQSPYSIFNKDNTEEEYRILKTKITYYYKLDEIDTLQSFIAYNKNNEMVNYNDEVFYQYDSLGRLIEKFSCLKMRDPECENLIKDSYLYENNRLVKIIRNDPYKDSIYVLKTFEYNVDGRVFMEKNAYELIEYEYIDRMIYRKAYMSFTNDTLNMERIYTHEYDSSGKLFGAIWGKEEIPEMIIKYKYDSNDRLIMKKDSSLTQKISVNSVKVFHKSYSYNSNNQLIEKNYFQGKDKKLVRKEVYMYEKRGF